MDERVEWETNIYFKKWSWDHLNNFLLWKKNVGDYLNYFKMSKDFLSIKAIEEIKDMKEKTKYIWEYIKLFVSRQRKQN